MVFTHFPVIPFWIFIRTFYYYFRTTTNTSHSKRNRIRVQCMDLGTQTSDRYNNYIAALHHHGTLQIIVVQLRQHTVMLDRCRTTIQKLCHCIITPSNAFIKQDFIWSCPFICKHIIVLWKYPSSRRIGVSSNSNH